MARKHDPLPGNLIYLVCERFLASGDGETGERRWTTKEIARWLTEEMGHPTTTQEIWPIVRQGVTRGYVQLHPPRAMALSAKLRHEFPFVPEDTRVFDFSQPTIVENLASEAASLIFELIQIVDAENKAAGRTEKDGTRKRVHIGLNAGGTTRRVAQALARRLEFGTDLPPLTFHALSSGFATNRPLTAPVAFFSYFTPLNLSIEFVGLFSNAVVKWNEYAALKLAPGIRESFEEVKKVDVVVTSLAQAGDEHGLLNMFLNMYGVPPTGIKLTGHVGDVAWQPYSETGPIVGDTGIRAVTLFDLEDLVKLAATPCKHVVLVAGPCGACGESKKDALRPLLNVRELAVCNHLVTDSTTAQQVLERAAA